MVRTTRRRHHTMHRRTLRMCRQHGGAPWDLIVNPARINIWKEVLPTDLQFVLDPSWARGADAMKRYAQIVARQDELMMCAREGVLRSMDLASELSTTELIAGYKNWIKKIDDDAAAIQPVVPRPANGAAQTEWDAFAEYQKKLGRPILDKLAFFNDIGALIYFTAPGKSDKMYDAKIQYFQQSSDYEKLKVRFLGILLYPQRVVNLFMYSLATSCVQLASTPAMLADVKDDLILQDILGKQFESYMMALSYTEASDELHDGFYLAQQSNNFKFAVYGAKNPTHFWSHFIRGCVKEEEAKNRWSRIAAIVYGIYADEANRGDLMKAVLTKFRDVSNLPSPIVEMEDAPLTEEQKTPDASETQKELVEGIKYADLVAPGKLALPELQYVIHLTQTIMIVSAPPKA